MVVGQYADNHFARQQLPFSPMLVELASQPTPLGGLGRLVKIGQVVRKSLLC